jgi:hypothetical protein
MSEGTVHPLVQPVGRTHASGAFDWRAVPSADPRTSAFALDTAPALPAAAEEFSGEACREIVEDLLDRTRTGAAVAEVHAPFCESKCDGCGCWQHAYKELESRRWADALVREMAAWADTHAQAGAPIQALRFGGGTPSALEPVDIWPKPVNICRFPTTAASSFRHVCTDSPKKRLRLRLRAASRGSSFR